eukprot:TRINITY_DN2304_c0_g1_i1.p1 TRINITY_DN2304_c0_g1~~TRINITY_DN2304_c0_g1_i1.p1  ORF type:complete len:392 (-),score=92.37 TRINITY_DN2304_c0_g1_i1:844-2019(-)
MQVLHVTPPSTRTSPPSAVSISPPPPSFLLLDDLPTLSLEMQSSGESMSTIMSFYSSGGGSGAAYISPPLSPPESPAPILITKVATKFNFRKSPVASIPLAIRPEKKCCDSNNVHNNFDDDLVLPTIPKFVEKNWSFYVARNSFDVIKEVSKAFDSTEFTVDYLSNGSKTSIFGMAYFRGYEIKFQVNMYRQDGCEKRILIEFQRVNGNALLFARFYSACFETLTSVFGDIQCFDQTIPVQSHDRYCLRSRSLIDLVDADVRMESMLWMVTSHSTENVREGLLSLVVMSFIQENVAVMCKNESLREAIIHILEEDFWEKDLQLMRLLCTLFANLSNASEFLEFLLPFEETEFFVLRCNEAAVNTSSVEFGASFCVSEIQRQVAKLKNSCFM